MKLYSPKRIAIPRATLKAPKLSSHVFKTPKLKTVVVRPPRMGAGRLGKQGKVYKVKL